MIKIILTLITKVLESKLVKSGLEATILKNQNYIAEAKQIWNMVDENFRISTTVEEKLKSKAEEFNSALLKKFPELSQEDVNNLRQSIAGTVNEGKAAVIDNSTLLQQLQNSKTQLEAENAELKNKLAQIQSAASTNANVVADTNTAQVVNAVDQTVNNTNINQQAAVVI
jgi:paraquat-inducible protein B